MSEELQGYGFIFTVEERKRITAKMLQELRKAMGYSQKEVAAFIKVKPTTYNTYESGRTEPPIEILVRLSYLYNVSIDVIVQKQRLFRDAEDLKKQLEENKKELAEIEKEIVEQGADSPAVQEHKRVMEKVIEQLEILIQNEETQKQLEP